MNPAAFFSDHTFVMVTAGTSVIGAVAGALGTFALRRPVPHRSDGHPSGPSSVTLTGVIAFEYLQSKIPTGATIAVIIAFISTLMTREMPLDLFDILFFLGVWLAGTIAAAVLLAVFEMVRDRWL